MMRPHAALLLSLVLVAPVVLAGCTGGDGGTGTDAKMATCIQASDELGFLIEVDQSQPRPGDSIHFSLDLRNDGDEPVPVPRNFTLQVADADGRVVMEFVDLSPRYDVNDTVQPNETLFLRRVGDTFPSSASPGDHEACANADPFHGTEPFQVHPQTFGDG